MLQAVWDVRELGDNPEWRMLWALRRSSDWPGRFARRTRSPGCLGVGRFGPCPCRSTGAGSAEVAAAKAARTPRSLREAVKMCAGRWPAGDGLRRGQFCWPPLGRTVGHQRATTWPPPGRISWPPTPGEVQTSSRSTRPRLRHPDRVRSPRRRFAVSIAAWGASGGAAIGSRRGASRWRVGSPTSNRAPPSPRGRVRVKSTTAPAAGSSIGAETTDSPTARLAAPPNRKPGMEPQILRVADVLAMTGLSRTTLWRRIKSGDFPPPILLGGPGSRAVGWRCAEVQAWIDERPIAA